jgi:Flp pilus assembly protein TadG
MRAKNKRGATLVEAAAAIVVIVPVVILLLFVVLEVSYAYVIQNSLAQGARQAARDLAIAYGQNPEVANDRALQESMVFDNIRIANIIANSAQFDNPTFDTAATPPTVSVTVQYLSNQYGLPRFPNPDPLHLGNSFTISASNTFRLE